MLENPGDGNLDGLGWSHGGNCSSGKVLHLSQPCAGMCNDNRKDILQDFISYIPCPPVTKINSVSQCIQQSEKSDNLFTCLNRADENPFSRQSITRFTDLDLSSILTKCTMGPWGYELYEGWSGLACPNAVFSHDGFSLAECVPYHMWCQKDIFRLK